MSASFVAFVIASLTANAVGMLVAPLEFAFSSSVIPVPAVVIGRFAALPPASSGVTKRCAVESAGILLST